MSSIVGILLAAGTSRRFGSRKLLHVLSDGTPIGLRAAQNLMAAVDRVIVVVAPGDDALASLISKLNFDVSVCANSFEGMGASLACGVRACPQAAGWVVALGDMPFISPATIRAIAQSLRDGAAIVAPVHNGERGHPVGFARRYGGELAALSGDEGAKALLKRDKERLLLLPVEDAGIHRDIDTLQDLDGS